ncbi:ABC transporter ATP-binding protein [Aliiglaciecola litoralis]|uniref:ABC transporter ATP-binding protein n=1 Tax=Aliiglaciecola litoralis TaxID=582857 RepID=A0ABP3WP97_9ALTE
MLDVKHAAFQINNKHILKDVSFNLPTGQILGVLGANGAGKTTLLKMIAGQRASKDMIYWHGRPIESLSHNEKAKQIAVVNQFNHNVFSLDLEQIISMGLLPHQRLFSRVSAQQKHTIADALAKVGLLAQRKQAFHTLSGGEQQRGLLARALVQRAHLIVLDEPINHLDVFYQHQILHLLKQLATARGLCVVMSLHDVNLAANYCDTLCLLNEGQMLAQGAPQDVLTETLLQSAFKTPCKVFPASQQHALRVEFLPHSAPHIDAQFGQDNLI